MERNKISWMKKIFFKNANYTALSAGIRMSLHVCDRITCCPVSRHPKRVGGRQECVWPIKMPESFCFYDRWVENDKIQIVSKKHGANPLFIGNVD